MPRVKAQVTEETEVKSFVVSEYNEKPFSVYAFVRTDANGFLSNFISMQFYRGPEKKLKLAQIVSDAEFKMNSQVACQYINVRSAEPAQAIATSLLQRFSMTTYSSNEARRLPANKMFFINLRVVVAQKDKSIRVLLRDVCPSAYKKGEFIVGTPLDRSDENFRAFRKAVKYMPEVFARIKFYDRDTASEPNLTSYNPSFLKASEESVDAE